MSDASSESPAKRPRALIWGACAAIGALSGTMMWPEPPARAAQPVQVHLAGVTVDDAETDLEGLSLAHAQHYLAGNITLRAGDTEVTLRRADLGARVDLDHLRALMAHARDGRSPMMRVHGQLLGRRPLSLPVPAALVIQLAWNKRYDL